MAPRDLLRDRLEVHRLGHLPTLLWRSCDPRADPPRGLNPDSAGGDVNAYDGADVDYEPQTQREVM